MKKLTRRLSYTALLLVCTGCTSLDGTIRDLGFTPLALPSASEGPGKVVMVSSADPLVPEPVCLYGTFSGSPQISKNPAASTQATQRLGGSFTLGGNYRSLLTLGAEAKAVRNVSVTLANVSVEELSWGDINAGLEQQKDGCAKSIRQGKEKNRPLSVIVRALKADGRFKIDFEGDATVSADAKAELLKNLAIKLGAGPTGVSGSEIVGAQLYWGVALNQDLVQEAKKPVPDRPPAQPGDDWNDSRFEQAKENIRWIFRDSGASSDYSRGREANMSKFQALLHAQRHNAGARGTIWDYGEVRANRLLETLGR